MSLVLSLLLRPVPLRGINGPRDFFTPLGHKCREVRRPGSALRPPPRNPPQHFLCEEILGTPGIPMPRKARHGRAGTPSPSRKGLRDLNAGQNSPANHPASTFVLPSADPPRRGFRGPAEPRCLTPALRAGVAPSSTQGAQSSPAVYPELFAQARKPG